MNGTDFQTCVNLYYSHWTFIYDNRIWYYYNYYSTVVDVIFIHGLWECFGVATLLVVVPELFLLNSLALGISFEILEPDPARALFFMLCVILGIACGLWMVVIIDSPRLIRNPHKEITYISVCYDKLVKIESWATVGRNALAFKAIRLKYTLQLLFITAIAYISIFILPYGEGDVMNLTPELIAATKKFDIIRVDWLVYLLENLVIIVVCYYWNYTTQIERFIWKNNKKKYKEFYVVWTVLFLILMLPGVVIWTSPPILMLIGVAGNFVFLLLYSIYKYHSRHKKGYRLKRRLIW